MNSMPSTLEIRSKILGTLIRDARIYSGKSLAECAQVLKMSVEEFETFELGKKSPSLPELEAIAFYLGVPIDQFWSDQTYSEKNRFKSEIDFGEIINIRNRIIGVLIRQARENEGYSLEELSRRSSYSVEEITSFEFGKKALSVPQLEVIARSLNRSIRDFQDRNSLIGQWIDQQRTLQELNQLPDELLNFIRQPANRPYLELVLRMSEMSVEKLRSIAEGILEITY